MKVLTWSADNLPDSCLGRSPTSSLIRSFEVTTYKLVLLSLALRYFALFSIKLVLFANLGFGFCTMLQREMSLLLIVMVCAEEDFMFGRWLCRWR